VRHNPSLRALFERLMAAGKHRQAALVACMHSENGCGRCSAPI